jgi:L-asparagine transporter-like permease
VLGLSGTFARLALVSAVSRLVVYVFTCAATLRLRSPEFAAEVKPPAFVVPFGPTIPAAATLIALATLAGARREQLVAGAVALLAGAVLFVVAVRSTRAQRLERA